MNKEEKKEVILFGMDAKKKIQIGTDISVDSFKITLGPKGSNVALYDDFGIETIINDGTRIARSISLDDSIENFGASQIKEVTQKTSKSAGGGTTTSAILTQAIFNEGMKRITLGDSPIGIKSGINKGACVAIDYLKTIAKQIKTEEEKIKVVNISSESEAVGKLVSETFSEMGDDAVVTVEKSPVVGLTSERSQGLEFETGFISPYMITDKSRQESEIGGPGKKDVPILITDQTIGVMRDMVPFLTKFLDSGGKELVIIAEDIIGEALQTFILNKLSGAVTILGIKAPGFGERKNDYLKDIAVVTGATLISGKAGATLDKIELSDLGHADRVVSTKDKTTIIGGKGSKEDIKERVESIKKELEGIESEHDRTKVLERIGKISGGVAVIKIGTPIEADTDYQKLKIEDGINALQSAMEEGVVSGGGVALIGASKAVLLAKDQVDITNEEMIGYEILAKALITPLQNIAINAGKGDGSMVVEKVQEMEDGGGYDALNDLYVKDMVKEGIADPLKITRLVIENAASMGGALLTTGCAIPKKKAPSMPMM